VEEEVLQIRGLTVRAGPKILLAIDRLSVRRGEFLGVLGPNGAGKTTLLRSCLGIQRHASGHVEVLGRPVGELGFIRRARLRRRIAYVPQLLPVRSEMPLTVREVVAIGRTGAAGLFRRFSRQDWRAMVQQPDILLLDEPTANLDLGWRERIVQLVESLYRSLQMTVLLVCHEWEVLPPSCRRVAVLRNGRLIADGAPEDMLTDELLESMYGPDLTVVRKAGRFAVVPGGGSDA
jgi:ABC-type cobalamin/Fe3+-siderophores transport system ATPase subunit